MWALVGIVLLMVGGVVADMVFFGWQRHQLHRQHQQRESRQPNPLRCPAGWKPEKGIKAMSDCCQNRKHRPSGTPSDSDRPSGHPGPGSDEATTLRVTGMDCADEVAAIERVLKPLAGVRDVRVNLMDGKVVVTHDRSVTIEKLIQAIGGAGLQATHGEDEEHDTPTDAQRSRLISVTVSGVLMGVGLVLEWSKVGPTALSIGTFAVAIIAGGWFILPKAIRAVRRFALDMNVLMTVAVIGAAAIGEW